MSKNLTTLSNESNDITNTNKTSTLQTYKAKIYLARATCNPLYNQLPQLRLRTIRKPVEPYPCLFEHDLLKLEVDLNLISRLTCIKFSLHHQIICNPYYNGVRFKFEWEI